MLLFSATPKMDLDANFVYGMFPFPVGVLCSTKAEGLEESKTS